MSSNKDDIFGGFFDFNGDGKTDIGEEWIGYKIIEDCMKEDNEQPKPTFTSRPYKMTSPPRNHVEPANVSHPKITTKEELKVQCRMRRTTIIGIIATALIMFCPVCSFLIAAYASYDPRNSASRFIISIFTIAGLVIGGISLYKAGKEINKEVEEITELKQSYKRNRQEEQ